MIFIFNVPTCPQFTRSTRRDRNCLTLAGIRVDCGRMAGNREHGTNGPGCHRKPTLDRDCGNDAHWLWATTDTRTRKKCVAPAGDKMATDHCCCPRTDITWLRITEHGLEQSAIHHYHQPFPTITNHSMIHVTCGDARASMERVSLTHIASMRRVVLTQTASMERVPLTHIASMRRVALTHMRQ